MSDIRDQRRREYLWSVSCTRRCCWCLDPTVMERGPHGQPAALQSSLAWVVCDRPEEGW